MPGPPSLPFFLPPCPGFRTPHQVETQFLLLELDQPIQDASNRQGPATQPASSAAPQSSTASISGHGDGGGSAAGSAGPLRPRAPAGYALMLPLIDSGRFRATLRPPR